MDRAGSVMLAESAVPSWESVVNLVLGALAVVAAVVVTTATMLLVRRRAPEGS